MQKKIAVINDIAGFGRCSISVSLPIISYLGIQCCPVPTSIFSNHTGYPHFFFDDYTDRMPEYIDNWKWLGLFFDGIATGFLGSAKQIQIVEEFIHEFAGEGTQIIIDPVMGDNGRLYSTYNEADFPCGHYYAQSDGMLPADEYRIQGIRLEKEGTVLYGGGAVRAGAGKSRYYGNQTGRIYRQLCI